MREDGAQLQKPPPHSLTAIFHPLSYSKEAIGIIQTPRKHPQAHRRDNYGSGESLVGQLHRIWRSSKRQAGPQNRPGLALGHLPLHPRHKL